MTLETETTQALLHQDMVDQDIIHTLRTAHQNQTQLIVMADQKANILIGIVVLIFTILFTNSEFITNIQDGLMLPFLIFLVIEIIALALALLVILPKNMHEHKLKEHNEVENPLFFGTYTDMAEGDYVSYLSDKLCEPQAAKKLLITDLYHQGMVLKDKYRLLKVAYVSSVSGVILFFAYLAIFYFSV